MSTDKITVVKVGGAVVEDTASLARLIDDFAAIDGCKILVHGGGRSATRIAAQLGIETKMVDGRRITDAEMLRVVTMVYGGLVNKQIVAALQAHGVNAVGLTGADMDVIRSHRRPERNGIDYGFVGDVDRVDGARLLSLISTGVTPVIAPLSHDGAGSMLNTNADTIAQSVATAVASLAPVRLVYCFEKPGVLADADDDASVIKHIDRATYQQLRDRGVVAGGMLPKLDNAFVALDSGVSEVVITAASAISESGSGTLITL